MELSEHARLEAGTAALFIVATCGEDAGTEYCKGVMAAFAVALVATIGPEQTHEVFCDAVGKFVPQRSAPKLVSKDGERV